MADSCPIYTLFVMVFSLYKYHRVHSKLLSLHRVMIYFLQDEGCLLECQGLKDGLCIFKVKKGLGSSSSGLPHIQKDNCLYGMIEKRNFHKNRLPKLVRDPDIEDRTQK